MPKNHYFVMETLCFFERQGHCGRMNNPAGEGAVRRLRPFLALLHTRLGHFTERICAAHSTDRALVSSNGADKGETCQEAGADEEPEVTLQDEVFYLRMEYNITSTGDGRLVLERKRKRSHGDLRNSHIH